MKISHVHALTFASSGLLIEPVPVAAAHAAHNFSHLFTEIIRQVHNTGALGFSEPALYTCWLAQIPKRGWAVQINMAVKQINTVG